MTRLRSDRGTALIEMAMVIPFLLLVAFGVVEGGLAFTTLNRVESATGAATRVGASSGNRVETDRDVLVTLKASLDTDSLAYLDRVVIFRPADVNGGVPAGCITAVGTGDSGITNTTGSPGCNSYSGATVRAVLSSSMTGFGGGASAKDRYWAPLTRKDTILGPPDYIGVWVRTTYKNHTNTYFGDFTITKSTVFRIEPDFGG